MSDSVNLTDSPYATQVGGWRYEDTGEFEVPWAAVAAVDHLCSEVRKVSTMDPQNAALQSKLDELRDLLIGEARVGGAEGLVPVVRRLQEVSDQQQRDALQMSKSFIQLERRVLEMQGLNAKELNLVVLKMQQLTDKVDADIRARAEAAQSQRAYLQVVQKAAVGATVTLIVTVLLTALYYGFRVLVLP